MLAVRWVALKRITDPTVGDPLFVEIASEALRVRELGLEDAKKLIVIARDSPQLLRNRWDEFVGGFAHADRTDIVPQSHTDEQRGSYGFDCHHDRVEGVERHLDDRRLSGLTFPPKPTDF